MYMYYIKKQRLKTVVFGKKGSREYWFSFENLEIKFQNLCYMHKNKPNPECVALGFPILKSLH